MAEIGSINSFVTGQTKIAVTSTAVALSSTKGVANGVIVKALSGNSGKITIGISSVNAVTDGTGNGFVIGAGEACPVPIADISQVYINGSAGDGVTYISN